MIIRICIDDDLEAIAILRKSTIQHINSKDYNKSIIENWSKRVDVAKLRKTKTERVRLVAEINKKIVGFCEHDFKGEINRLYVDKDLIRRGIGTKLLVKAEESLKKYGFSTIRIESSVTAKKFYESHGYVVKEEFLYNNQVGAVGFKMVKNLD